MIFDKLAASYGGAVHLDVNNPAIWNNFNGGRQTTAGEDVGPDSAMALPAYAACVKVLSEDEAKLPLITYKRLPGGGKERATDHANYKLLRWRPNTEMTAMSFRETVTAHALGWRGGFAEIERSGAGQALNLWPIHPSRVDIKRTENGTLFYEIRTAGINGLDKHTAGRPIPIPAQDMIHIHGLGDNGITGFATSSVGREAIGVGLAQQSYRGAFFGNGAMPGAAVTPLKTMSEDAKNNLRSAWVEKFSGADNSNKIAVLDPGMTLTTYGIDPKDAQLIDASDATVLDICRLFRIQPHKIMDLRRATFSNIEQQSIDYVTDALMSWLIRWEQEIQRKLFANDDEHFTEHLVDSLLRGDAVMRATANQLNSMNGFVNVDEVRAMENRNPLPDGLGQKYYRPANLIEIGEKPPPPQPPAFGQPTEPDPEQDDGDGNNANASTALLASAMSRVIQKESNAMARLAKKHDGNADAFGTAVGLFYSRHAGEVSTEMAAAANLAAAFDNGVVDAEAVVACAERHCKDSSAVICVSFRDGTVANTLEHWKTNAASIVADRLHKAAFGSNDND